LFFENTAIGNDKKIRIIDLLKKSRDLNFLAQVMEVRVMISSGMMGDALDKILNDPRFMLYEGTPDLLVSCVTDTSAARKAAIYISRQGIFREPIFNKLIDQMENKGFWEEVNLNYRKTEKLDQYEKFLDFITHFSNDFEFTKEYISLSLKIGNTEKARALISTIQQDKVITLDDIMFLAESSSRCADLENALKFIKKGIDLYPENVEVQMLYAQILKSTGRESDAYKMLLDMIDKYRENSKIISLGMELAYSCMDYQNYLNLYNQKQKGSISESEEEWKIQSEINLSLFDEANRDIVAALAKNQRNLNILRLKLRLEKTIGKESEAMETAEKILSIDPSDSEGAFYVISSLYERREYVDLIERYSKLSYKSGQITSMYVSALMNDGKVSEAISLAESDPEILSNKYFLDTVFKIFREESMLKMLDSLSSKFPDSKNIQYITEFLRGLDPQPENRILDLARETGSVALGWIAISHYIDFRSKSIPSDMDKLLSRPDFSGLRILSSTIMDIYNDSYREDIRDSPFFMYPVTDALIDKGDMINAEIKLNESYDRKKSDPFYYYMLARIEAGRSLFNDSLKNLKKGLSILNNQRFVIMIILNSISTSSREDLLLGVSSIINISRSADFPYEQIYSYSRKNSIPDVLELIYGLLKGTAVENVWAYRIMRDHLIAKGDLKGAEVLSSKITAESSRMDDDILTHASLLKKNGKIREACEFLEPLTDGKNHIVTLLANLYFETENFKRASELFSLMDQSLLTDLDKSRYAESLINNGNFKAAKIIIDKYNLGKVFLGKLYLKSMDVANLKALVENMNPKVQEEASIISETVHTFWNNADIRRIATGIYRNDHNPKVGKAIASAQEKASDLKDAIEIRKSIYKDMPIDYENIISLVKDLVDTGEFSDGIVILRKWLKNYIGEAGYPKVFSFAVKLYYERGYFDEVISLYEGVEWVPDPKTLTMVIRSYIERQEYDTADLLLGRYQGTLVHDDEFNEMVEEMKIQKSFFEIVTYAKKLLMVEYKLGRTLDIPEAISIAEIPVDKVDLIYNFLGEEQYYEDINESRYEMMSMEVIQHAVRKTRISGIHDLKINVIFANMDRPNVIVAKNLYLYIKNQVRKRRRPSTEKTELNKLLKIALRKGLKPEPLQVSYELRVGISSAMDIITLMEYVLRINGGT
jgi:tetratricopeptide (TPR) repeat protein